MRELKKRIQVDPKEHYRYTPDLQTPARPVDTFVEPRAPKKGPGLVSLVDTLDSFFGTVRRTQDEKLQQDREDAAIDAASGEPPREDASEEYWKIYEKVKGQGDLVPFKTGLQQLYYENANDTPDELAVKVEKYTQDWLIGKSKHYLAAFKPGAADAIAAIDVANMKQQKNILDNENLVNATSVIRHHLETVSDPQQLRAKFSELQTMTSALGIPKTEISKIIYEQVYSMALATNDSRYIESLFKPDKDGITIADVVGPEKAVRLIDAIESKLQADRRDAEALEKEREKREINALANKFINEVYQLDPSDVTGHKKKREELFAFSEKLDSGKTQSFHSLLDAHLKVGEWREESLPAVRDNLFIAIHNGTFTDLNRLSEYRESLNNTDYIRAFEAIVKKQNQMSTREGKDYEALLKAQHRLGLGRITAVDMFGNAFEKDGPEKARAYDEAFYDLVEAKREEIVRTEGSDRFLTRKELYQIQDEAVKRVKERYTEVEQAQPEAQKPHKTHKPIDLINRLRHMRTSSIEPLKGYDLGAFASRVLGPSEAHAATIPKGNFNDSFELVMKFEGGYSNDSSDRGGETNFGISSKANPDIDVKNLTLEEAKKIYKERYWNPSGAESLPYPLSVIHFDTAVHHGVETANKILEASDLDPKVYLALRKMRLLDIVGKDSSQEKFKKGWMNRVAALSQLIQKG